MKCVIFSVFLFLQSLFSFDSSNYPEYVPANLNKGNLWYFLECNSAGAYLKKEFLPHIDKNEVKSILEIGSRDLRDAFDLSEYYKCHVFAFECNPECLSVCRINEQKLINVTLIEMAAWNDKGLIVFFPTMHAFGKISNPGFSSCFCMTPKTLNSYKQSIISVLATRLDAWIREQDFDSIDLLCINANGASLKVLEGLGNYLHTTKYIIAECTKNSRYNNSCYLSNLINLLIDNGFRLVFTEVEDNFLFINCSLDEK